MELTPSWIVILTEWLGVIAVAWLLSATPRFRKQTVGFRYARRDGIVALTVGGVLVLIGWIFASSSPGKMLGNSSAFRSLPGVSIRCSSLR